MLVAKFVYWIRKNILTNGFIGRGYVHFSPNGYTPREEILIGEKWEQRQREEGWECFALELVETREWWKKIRGYALSKTCTFYIARTNTSKCTKATFWITTLHPSRCGPFPSSPHSQANTQLINIIAFSELFPTLPFSVTKSHVPVHIWLS